jgi:hypothetical protein
MRLLDVVLPQAARLAASNAARTWWDRNMAEIL